MKSILFYSGAFNGILILCLVLVIHRGKVETQPPAATAAPSSPFLWSRIESPDWATYISNLRRFECPERDIRAIIFSEIDATYLDKRDQIKKNSPDPDMSLQRLQQEEDDLIASLFGDEKPRVKAPLTAPMSVADVPAHPVPTGVPLVVMPGDAHALVPASIAAASDPDLNADQLQKIQQISDRFVRQIGVQNPNDSTYMDRWEKAQQEADESLKMVLGQEAYQRSMLQAGQIDTRP